MSDIESPLITASRDFPGQSALINEDFTFTYPKYLTCVSVVKTHLINAGIRPCDRVSCLIENRLEYPIVLMALLHLGAVACTLSTRLPSTAINHLLKKVKTPFFITTKKTLPIDFSSQAKLIFIEDLVDLNVIQGAPTDNENLSLDQDASIMFTSGSMGIPKPVVLSFGNHYYSALGSNMNIPLGSLDRWLITLPLYHVGGQAILYRAMLAGAACVIPKKPDDVLENIKKFKITHVSLVSTQLFRLLKINESRKTLSSIKAILIGGSAIPQELLNEAYAKGLPVHVTYGLTEMASQVSTTRAHDSVEKLLTAGVLLPHRELKISGSGEIFVRGKTLFKGYIEEENIHRPGDAEGWFHTGDTGYMTDKGTLVITGRADNMFISGGENIQPEEIEAALTNIPDVRQAIVVPVENAEFGWRPVAFVKMRDNVSSEEKSLDQELRRFLPGYKIPDHFLSWPENALNPEGKPDRQKLALTAKSRLTSSPSPLTQL
ncbi:o-succinylbenzoate--CoA ligase [PVC group bacterium]|nr:o-succinylbenzoate--CoA ligase [PVC group bacterium]